MRSCLKLICIAVALCWATPLAVAQEASTLNSTGVQQYEAHDFEAAINSFTQAYNLAPDSATVRRNLCNAYQALANEHAKVNDFDSAIKLLSNAIGVDPQNASPLTQLGSYLLRTDLVTDAVPRLEEAVELDDKNADAHYLLGEAYYRQNDLAAALAQWQLTYELDPKRDGLKERIERAQRHDMIEAKYRRSSSRNFEVSYTAKAPGADVGRILQILERARWDIGRKLGGAYPPPPIQVIVQTSDDFSNATLLGKHIGGVYDGKIRLPVPSKSESVFGADEMQRILYHEYTHCVVRYIARDNVPWWLNEGLAETLSRKFTPAMAEMLRQADQNKQLPALSQLEGNQLEALDPASLERAYALGHAATRWLWERFGQNAMVGLLNALASGEPAEQALTEQYRRNYGLLQTEVMANLDRLAN